MAGESCGFPLLLLAFDERLPVLAIESGPVANYAVAFGMRRTPWNLGSEEFTLVKTIHCTTFFPIPQGGVALLAELGGVVQVEPGVFWSNVFLDKPFCFLANWTKFF